MGFGAFCGASFVIVIHATHYSSPFYVAIPKDLAHDFRYTHLYDPFLPLPRC